MTSRAIRLCKDVHDVALAWRDPLRFVMVVRGSNGTATYHFCNQTQPTTHVVQQRPKGDETDHHLTDLSQLDIGTLSKVTFKTLGLPDISQFMHAVVTKLHTDRQPIYLWTVSALNGEFSFNVLKSSTTAQDYEQMLSTYAAAPMGPVKSNKNGYPSRPVATSYSRLGIDCATSEAYPGFYKGGKRPNKPANQCNDGNVHQAPDGTSWKVRCVKPSAKQCRWKVEEGPGGLRGSSRQYNKVQQLGPTAVPGVGDERVGNPNPNLSSGSGVVRYMRDSDADSSSPQPYGRPDQRGERDFASAIGEIDRFPNRDDDDAPLLLRRPPMSPDLDPDRILDDAMLMDDDLYGDDTYDGNPNPNPNPDPNLAISAVSDTRCIAERKPVRTSVRPVSYKQTGRIPLSNSRSAPYPKPGMDWSLD